MSTGRSLGRLVLAAACAGCTVSQGEETAELAFDRVQIAVGVPTNAIATADVNRDSRLDLVVSGGERVVVLAGRGDGRFEIASVMDGGEHPTDLAVADLDGDERDDLAVANHETEYVTLLFGTADDGFQRRAHSRLSVNVAPHPHAVELHDIDADGHVDLLVDDRSGEGIRVFKGVGDGTFSTTWPVGVGGDPYRGFTVADLDRDGVLDLVTPNPNHVAVLIGDGSGRFTADTALRPGFPPFSVAAGDVNGDGVIDVVAGSGERVGTLAVWFGSTDGSFRPGGRFTIADGPTALGSVDLTGDGRAEILVASYMGAEVAVLVGGETLALQRLDLAGHPYMFATGDFDGDGRMDFAVANDGSEAITVFLSRH
jgi:hypothetical protein